MKKRWLCVAVLSVMLPLLFAAPAQAGVQDFSAEFSTSPANLYFTQFQSGVRTPGLACGTDACAAIEASGPDSYLRIAVNPSLTPGYYTNTDVSQVQLGIAGATGSGPYTATFGHPVTMEARMKLSANYDLLGLSDAQGTTGIALWNSAIENTTAGPSGEYDQIGFVWSSSDVLLGLITGFTASTFVNQLPLGIARPLLPFDIHNWITVKMVWSENILGVQTVQYYLNGSFFAVHILPVKLHGLSLELWNDNQEPYPCIGGGGILCFNYPNPTQTQSLYVDYVHITQPD